MRYTGPARIRFRGDPTLAKAYIPEGRKYLGDLQQQLQRGKIAIGERSLTNLAGVAFRVQWVGAQALLEIDVSQFSGESLVNLYLGGFVTRPRNAGTTGSGSDGQNAFGQLAHVVLRGAAGPAPDEPSVWKAYYYDGPPGEEVGGNYRVTPAGNVMFDDGLVDGGTTDWRDGSETLAVSWTTRPGRAVVYDAGFTNHVFHNGIRILNTSILPSEARQIACACLRKWQGQWYLLFIASSVGTRFMCYRAALTPEDGGGDYAWVETGNTEPVPTPQWPRMKPLVLADCELLLDYFPDASENGLTTVLGHMSFNQSGTEARCITPRVIGGVPIGDDSSGQLFEFAEIIIDFATPEVDEVTGRTEFRGQQGDVQVSVNEFPVCSPNVEAMASATADPRVPPGGGFTGMVPRTIHLHDTAQPTFIGTADNFTTQGVVLINRQAKHTETSTPYNPGAVPILVEYEDDVPVYLWWELGSGYFETNWTAAFSNTSVITGYAVNDYYVAGALDHTDNLGDFEILGQSSHSSSWSGGISRHRFYAVDKNGDTWWDTGFESCTLSGDTSGTASLTDQRHRIAPADTSNEASSSSSSQRNGTRTRSVHFTYYLDLRYRAAMGGTCTITTDYAQTRTTSSAGGPTVSTNSQIRWQTPWTGTLTINTQATESQASTFVVNVYAYGVKVREFTTSQAWDPAVTNTTTTPSTLHVLRNVMQYGLDRTGGFTSNVSSASQPLPCSDDPVNDRGTFPPSFAPYTNAPAKAIYDALLAPYLAVGSEARGPWDHTTSDAAATSTTTNVSTSDVEYYDRFVRHSTFLSENEFVSWDAVGQTAVGGFSQLAVDAETQITGTPGNPGGDDGRGRMLCYRGNFAYSLFDFDDRADIRVRAWKAEAGVIDRANPATFDEASIVSLDSITGNHGSELHGHMWPLSFPIFLKA